MIACLYGRSAELFVAPMLARLQRAASERGAQIDAVSVEAAVAADREWQGVRRVYVLPFDIPPSMPAELPTTAPQLIEALFPRAEILNPPIIHELCWDKPSMTERLFERGVSVPESLITSDPDVAREFVDRHGQAILKAARSCGGHGHVVLFADASGTIAGEVAPGRRYAVEFVAAGTGRSLAHGVLSTPPPFYLQRLVARPDRSGALKPGPIVRAYVVDRQIAFWTERYRDRVRRPSDFVITATFGAKQRFLPAVSDAVQTAARRAADALGIRVGVVDVIHAGEDGPFVIDVSTDGYHMMIDRSFTELPEYRDIYDFDGSIAELLLAESAEPERPPPLRRPRPTTSAARRPRGARRR
jgi:glutathione synthase/RimK-type ligase-like ATP-grasp enzyme